MENIHTSVCRRISSVLAVEFPLIRPLICSCLRTWRDTEVHKKVWQRQLTEHATNIFLNNYWYILKHVFDTERLWEVSYCQFTLTTSCLKSRMLCHWLRSFLSASCRLLACWSSWMHRSLIWSLAAACITHWSSTSRADLPATKKKQN